MIACCALVCGYSYSGTEDAEFDFLEDFLTIMSTLPRADRKQLGHRLEDTFIGCTWQGKECSARSVAPNSAYFVAVL